MGDYMGSAFTPPMDREGSPRLNNGTFRAFVHDTHHAYLLLHRAFQSLPPTVIPNIVPASPPGHGELDQPDYLRPASLPDARDILPSPSSMNEDDEKELFKTTTDQDPPPRMAKTNLPPTSSTLPGTSAAWEVPIPNSALSKSPLSASAAPKPAPDRRRRSTGSHLDRAAEARNISRSRSPSASVVPRAWTPEDLAKLRELKQDGKARPNWKTVAGKLARGEDDCKRRWKRLKEEDARK